LVLPILSLRAGARGGLLTPSVAVGALLGLVLGAAWDHVSPGVPHRAFALVGAAAFLASSQGMPLTAMVLLAELARVDFAAILPMMLAVGGSAWVTAALKAVKEPRAIE
jgi:H+/Cl- antiporter ClcA